MEIRVAEPSEWEAAGRVTVEGFAPFTRGEQDPYVAHLRDAATRAREADLLVAVEGGAVLGCVTSCPPGSPWRELSTPDQGEFRMLSVRPGAQGRGIGTALVAACEDRARDADATSMIICSLQEMTAAHDLYARLDYRRAPDRDWSPVDGVHLISFTKELR